MVGTARIRREDPMTNHRDHELGRELSLARLLNVLAALPETRRYIIAFSGGADSLALAHAMIQLRSKINGASLLAVHVDHQLQVSSGQWASHCTEVCQQLNLELLVSHVTVGSAAGKGLEAQARTARYAAILTVLEPGDVVLTAHHLDDQAETVMLRLLRGSGLRGLAAIPVCKRFGTGWLARPLLDVSGASLRSYTLATGLPWVEDTSNFDTRFDRNYLRHEVMPKLAQRWPGMSKTLCRAARQLADAESVLAELAAADVESVRLPEQSVLVCDRLSQLSVARAQMAIRSWLEMSGFALPSAKHCQQILDEVVASKSDRTPRVSWGGVEVRRFRGGLYARRVPRGLTWRGSIRWQLPENLELPHGHLRAEEKPGTGLLIKTVKDGLVRVCLRRGGERLKLYDHHRTLKNLFQESGVPPWERDTLPLIYVDDLLVAVAGRWIHVDYCARGREPGWQIDWYPD